jgi:hypothetical protein
MSYGFYFSRSWEWYRHRGAIEECLARDQGSYRYFVTPKTEKSFSYQPVDREIVNNGYGSLFKLYSVGGVETIGLLSYKTFLDALYRSPSLDMGVRYLEMSGAKKLVTGYPLENRMFTALCSKETDGKTAYVYQYEQSPIRAKIYGSAYGVENDAQMVEKVRDPRADPQSTLILLSESKPFSRNKVIESDVRFEEYKPDRVVLTYNADGDGFLYLSDSYYPGWRAYVDEKETRIYRANLAFRAIEVPAGRHRVVFKYVPGSFYCGLFLTIIGILLCGYISWHGKRGKHNA